MIVIDTNSCSFIADRNNTGTAADSHLTAAFGPDSFRICRRSLYCRAIITGNRDFCIPNIRFACASKCLKAISAFTADISHYITADSHLSAAFAGDAAGVINFSIVIRSTADRNKSIFTYTYLAAGLMAVNPFTIITSCCNSDLCRLAYSYLARFICVKTMRYDTAFSIFYCYYGIAIDFSLTCFSCIACPHVNTSGAADIGSNVDQGIFTDLSRCPDPVFNTVDMPQLLVIC